MKSTNRPRSVLGLTKALLRKYRKLVVPHGASRYHVRKFGQWPAARWPSGECKRLDRYAIENHLNGKGLMVAAKWSLDGEVSHAVIDLDSTIKHVNRSFLRDNPEEVHSCDALLRLTLGDVLEALGFPPHVVVRSSSTRGLHIYLFFDTKYPARRVSEVIVGLLTAHGCPPNSPGGVDKVYPSKHALRLPFGPGSCILDDTDFVSYVLDYKAKERKLVRKARRKRLQPLPGFFDPPPLKPVSAHEHHLPHPPEVLKRCKYRGDDPPAPGVVSLYRDLPASVAELATRVETSRIPLSQLEALLSNVRSTAGRGGVLDRKKSKKTAKAQVRALSENGAASFPLAAAGTRHDQSRRLLGSLHAKGIDRDEALGIFEDWLRASAGDGTSRDLLSADEDTIQRYLRDGEGYWTWLEEHSEPLTHPTPFVALSTIAGVPPASVQKPAPGAKRKEENSSSFSLTTTPRDWDRAATLEALTTVDRDQLASKIDCSWWRAKLEVLVGLLRQAEAKAGPLSHVTIGARVVDRVLGGRPPPATALSAKVFGEPRRPHAMLFHLADVAGYLVRLDRGIKDKRASLCKVTMPPIPARRRPFHS